MDPNHTEPLQAILTKKKRTLVQNPSDCFEFSLV